MSTSNYKISLIEMLKKHQAKSQSSPWTVAIKADLLPCAVAYIEAGIPNGNRDICLFILAKHCRRVGLTKVEALTTLEQANATYTPPLPERDLKDKLKSAYDRRGGPDYSALGCDEPAWQGFCPGREGCPVFSPAPEKKSSGEAKPLIVRLGEVEPEKVAWLWEPYIPLGKLTILEGDPGIGKTWLSLKIAAIISRGDTFPGAEGIPRMQREPANVVYLSAEDGLADTLRPRLDKAGADANRIYALTGWEEVDPETGRRKNGSISLAALDVIETALMQIKPNLVVVDPIQAYLGAGVDMHRANEVRPVLAGLAALAEKHKFAALCIRHLGKSGQDRVIYRGLGSIDFAAAARSILLVGQHPDDERRRVLAQQKFPSGYGSIHCL